VELTDDTNFLARLDQNPVLGSGAPYAGNFDPGVPLLTTAIGLSLSAGAVTIDFLDENDDITKVLGAGLHLQLNPSPGGGHLPFTVVMTAFDFDGSQFNELASFFSPEGDSCMAPADLTQLDCPFGTALFMGIGAQDLGPGTDAPRISRIVFDVRAGVAGSGAEALTLPQGNFAFDRLVIGSVPEPASLVLVGLGLVGTALVHRRRTKVASRA
jgi:hypothetical protein